ncbi:MAG TPA: SRPBCC family protein [Phycisphaerales bacterium]|nr:SRPBCC family protein [Phycisphaerales bacterium]
MSTGPASPTASGTTLVQATDRELILTRTYDAPRALVWKAFTDPQQMVQWWGPDGFTTTMTKWDFRVGGVRKYTMHGPDGVNYPNAGVFLEIVDNERLVWNHGGGREEGPGASFVSTATFEDVGEKGSSTRLTLRMTFATPKEKDLVMREYGAVEGGKQTLARLEGYLPAMTDKPFTITRTFDAPLDVVWRAWTDPARLAQWWGPKGVTSTMKTFNLKPGGLWHCSLQASGQPTYWGKYTFREVTPKSRLVFTVSFSNEQGDIVKHPLSADWPAEILSTIEFTAQGEKTAITVTWVPINATETERRTFTEGESSMRGGWTGTLDQLEAYLASSAD